MDHLLLLRDVRQNEVIDEYLVVGRFVYGNVVTEASNGIRQWTIDSLLLPSRAMQVVVPCSTAI